MSIMMHLSRIIKSIIVGTIAWLGILTLNGFGVPLFAGILSEFGLFTTIVLVLIEAYTVYLPN